MKNDKIQFIYKRESFISSLASDIVSFGSIVGLMFMIFNYWEGHWYVTIFIMIIWFISVASEGSKHAHKFYGIDDCIAYLQKEKELATPNTKRGI